MKKIHIVFLYVLCLAICFTMISCSNEVPRASSSTKAQTQSVTDKHGTVSIRDVVAWIDGPASDFYPVFSIPENAEALTYTYDTEGLLIDGEAQTVKALTAGEYTVTVTSEHLETAFRVTAQKVNHSEKDLYGRLIFSAAEYDAQASSCLAQWNEYGTDGKTTVFIGDSFFDTVFWNNFYSTSYRGKDALCLGISATTTQDWESWITSGWMSQITPKNIVMHVGTNNVYDNGETVSECVASLQRMFLIIHQRLPNVPIYWFGISQRSYDTAKIADVAKINKEMQIWCDARDYITYIDTPSRLKNDMLKDNIHPRIEYYSVFTDALAQTDIEIAEKTVSIGP